jgi:hypothetical protein
VGSTRFPGYSAEFRTAGVEDFRHPTGTITRNKVEDTLVTVTRTSNQGTCILAGPFPEERTNIPPWIRRLMNCHRSETR